MSRLFSFSNDRTVQVERDRNQLPDSRYGTDFSEPFKFKCSLPSLTTVSSWYSFHNVYTKHLTIVPYVNITMDIIVTKYVLFKTVSFL